MKASRFMDARKAFMLRQAGDGVPIGDICRKAGISQATFYSWRKQYAGMTPPEMRRLKVLEEENARLKELVAELSLDRAMASPLERHWSEDNGERMSFAESSFADVSRTIGVPLAHPARKRRLAAAVQVEWGVSERRPGPCCS